MKIALVALGFVLLAAACTGELTNGGPGSANGGGGGGGGGTPDGVGPDAGVGSGGGGGGGGGGTPDAGAPAFACRDKVVNGLGSGFHNPNQDCMNGCHNHGFTLAGTVSLTTAGGGPVVGATITVKDAANKTFDMVTMQNGNFYTSTAVTFPVTVVASSCPDVKPMVGSIAASGGGCNKNGCHVAGAGTGAIHLP